MGDTEIEFITRFHNLEGFLVTDRKKNFFKMLQDKSLLPNEEQLNIVLRNLQPKTYLESLLRIDMLIYFKKTAELLEILKEGNEIFMSKIIKQPWFFKEAFQEISAEELVNDFLPCTSFAVRMKILKRLTYALNEAQIDELFDCVLKRYGLYIATNILHCCSSIKIYEILSNNEIYLRPNQVTFLLDRNPILFKSYLRYYENITKSPYNEKYVFKYIALKNPQLLLELKKDEKLTLLSNPFGRRLSKKIINLAKDDVMRDLTSYMSLLKHNVIVRALQGNFKDVYFELFPTKLEELNISNLCNKLLLFYPKNRQWDLFVQTFTRVFKNQSIMDNLDYLSIPFINMCADVKVKQQWAEVKYNKTNNDAFLKYYDPAKSNPLFKDKMNSKSYDRSSLTRVMIQACKEYNDLTALENVLQYGTARFRNASIYDRKSFLDEIRTCFPLEQLAENHWKYINQIIDIAKVKMYYNYHDYKGYMNKYLEFLFKNGKSFGKELSQFVEDAIYHSETFWPQINNGAIEREILIQILNVLPDKIDENDKDYNSVYQRLVSDVLNFCLVDCNAKYCIRLLDFLHVMTFIKSILDKTGDFEAVECEIISHIILYNQRFSQHSIMIETAKLREIVFGVSVNQDKFYFEDLLVSMLTKKNRFEPEDEMLKLYFNEIIDKHVCHSISFWFLRNEPEVLVPYARKIATLNNLDLHSYGRRRILYNRVKYLKEIKLCSHLNIDVAFVDYFQEQLKVADNQSKELIMKCLSILLPTDSFITVISEYFLPKKLKLDLQDEEMKKIYKSQCEVAKILKDTSEPVKMLPVVMKFCFGDYLQSALRSLYSVCYRSPENQLHLYTDILSERAVSVKKHALFLSCALLDCKSTVNRLRTAEQGNVSSQKHIFLTTQKYFLRNQSEDLLDLLISNMNMIDKNDTETFCSLSSIKVPKKFQVLYIEKCWQFLESVKENIMVDDYLRAFLYKINESTDIVVSLSSEFCKDLIKNYLGKQTDNLLYMESYVCKVLRYRESDQIENFNFVFNVISTLKVKNKNDQIIRFFNGFYATASTKPDPKFVILFSTYWEQLFTPVEMFDEYVLLKLFKLKLESNEPIVKNYAKNVVAFMEQLITEYSLYVYNPFKLLLKRALTSHFVEKRDKYLFFYNVLKCSITATTCILVIDLMLKVNDKHLKQDREIFDVYCDILGILRRVEDPIVKVFYKSYVKEI